MTPASAVAVQHNANSSLPIVRTNAFSLGGFLAELLPFATNALGMPFETRPCMFGRLVLVHLIGVGQHWQIALAGDRLRRLLGSKALVIAFPWFEFLDRIGGLRAVVGIVAHVVFLVRIHRRTRLL